MYLENVVIDAQDPRTLGRFWQALLGGTTLTDESETFETRIAVPEGPTLDLCLSSVPEPVAPHPRLHLDITGGHRQAEVVQKALGLGARHLDIGQGDVPWVVLADPEGNPFCVMEARPEYAVSGPIAALPLDSADPARDVAFWRELTGWAPVSSSMPAALRHPSGWGRSWNCAPSRVRRAGPRTACTSTSASRGPTTRIACWRRSSSSAGVSCTPGGASCRGGSSQTRRGTSCACSRPEVPDASDNPFEVPPRTSVD